MARGDQLEERNRQLAALHVGLITTTLKTLALRDHMTARHSAAVARYARAMAEELGLDAREQEVIHTAALFHDVGKFIFPDSILLAERGLTDEEFEIVKRHPAVGADLIRGIDGYGEVADIVLAHHERIDGRGYPDGRVGDDIPLGSRIIAVADVYDVVTSRDTYRKPVSTAEAFAELRRVAGTQLDAHVVEVFIDLVQRRGVRFRHATVHDFEEELSLERRVSDYAAPLQAA
jgi:putative nucleotidyltransferase with HDIG domain